MDKLSISIHFHGLYKGEYIADINSVIAKLFDTEVLNDDLAIRQYKDNL